MIVEVATSDQSYGECCGWLFCGSSSSYRARLPGRSGTWRFSSMPEMHSHQKKSRNLVCFLKSCRGNEMDRNYTGRKITISSTSLHFQLSSISILVNQIASHHLGSYFISGNNERNRARVIRKRRTRRVPLECIKGDGHDQPSKATMIVNASKINQNIARYLWWTFSNFSHFDFNNDTNYILHKLRTKLGGWHIEVVPVLYVWNTLITPYRFGKWHVPILWGIITRAGHLIESTCYLSWVGGILR